MNGFSFNRGLAAAALFLLASTPFSGAQIPLSSVVNVHGSGTTNPSKCFWAIMEQIEARTKQPTHLTYRAVGSTTGIAEFVNTMSLEDGPANDFGAGDLPLNATTYQRFQDEGITVIHLPVVLGAVTFFHSVGGELDLDACLLARIFKRDITDWNHEDIRALNPGISATEEQPITVAHRVRGSSSTSSITQYLHAACPEEWPEDMVGSRITWPDDTIGCEGSGGMTTCIQETEGTIGYIDAGHGLNAGLTEIKLKNFDGEVLSSSEAAAQGGIAAAENGALPSDFTDDFSQVSLLNRPGQFTWPIVLMSYVYVRQDLSYFENPEEAGLLVAFLRALYDEDYVQKCADDFGFTLPDDAAREKALDAIDDLKLPDNTTLWTFEDSTFPIGGQEQYVISSKRQRISDVERSDMSSDIATLMEENKMLMEKVAALEANSGMTGSQETQLMAALVMSSICFILVIFSCIGFSLRFFTKA